MKIAVYAIAKNEEQNIEGWYESAKDADELVLLDTGSDDDTYDTARRLGIKTFREEIVPWRFDDGRNRALLHVSEDVDFCIALDLDERLQPGWREAFKEVKKSTTRIKYHMTYIKDGNEITWYLANRCHHRKGYHWEYAVHEKPVRHDGPETFQILDFHVHHIPDEDKPRNYLEMLRENVERHPSILRYSMLYGRELLFSGKKIAAYAEFQRWLTLVGSRTKQEYAEAYRLMGHCQINPLEDLLESLKYGERRETYIDIAKHYNDRDQWRNCLEYCDKAFAITEYPDDFVSLAYAWGDLSYSMASMAAMNIGEFELAKEYVRKGLSTGSSQRLLNNLRLIEVNQSLSLMV